MYRRCSGLSIFQCSETAISGMLGGEAEPTTTALMGKIILVPGYVEPTEKAKSGDVGHDQSLSFGQFFWRGGQGRSLRTHM